MESSSDEEYSVDEEEGPIDYDGLDDELKSQFDHILYSIRSIDSNSSTAEIVASNEFVCREVTAKPILGRIIKGLRSLLWYACAVLNEQIHPTIKCLIEINPSALLGKYTVREDRHNIARHPTHCVLMPWIAANHKWVINCESWYTGTPVLFDLLHPYGRRESVPTGCTAATIQQFLEAYPQGLTQVNNRGHTPLHAILLGPAECKPDLVKWMAEKCPGNMSKTDNGGCTPLHIACFALTHHLGDDSSEICKYLIAKCPESVLMARNSVLPIHLLLRLCQHRLVKELVVCLLREYPESYAKCLDRTLVPSSIQFVNRIKPLLDEEMELKENIVHLHEVSGVFQVAVKGTDNPRHLASSTCDVFRNWATITFVKRLEARLEQTLTELQDECITEEEQDRGQETDE